MRADLITALRRAVASTVILVTDGASVRVRGRRKIPPGLLDALRPFKEELVHRLDPDAITSAFNLPPGPLPAGMATLLLLYQMERENFSPAELEVFRALVALEVGERNAPTWYAEITAVENTIMVSRGASVARSTDLSAA